MKVFVPPIKIQGIKTKLVPFISKYIPEEQIWLEPFMGSGVVGFNLAGKNAIFSDINPHIINFYNALKTKTITPNSLKNYLEEEGGNLRKKDAEHYYDVRDRFNKFHEPLDFLFLNRACFNGLIRFNKDYNFNTPYGHKPERFSKAYITKIVNQTAYVCNKLMNNNWQFICQPFENAMEQAHASCFVYCDPPYIGRHTDYYTNWDERLEGKLCSLLQNSGAKFMLSTWVENSWRKNEYLEKLWSFCQMITKNHFYHLGAKEENRNKIVEGLLINYKAEKRKQNHRTLLLQARLE